MDKQTQEMIDSQKKVIRNVGFDGNANKDLEEAGSPPYQEKKGLPIIGGFFGAGNKVRNNPTIAETEESRPDEPFLELILDNREVRVFKNVKPGVLEIETTDSKRKAYIFLTHSKLLTQPWGNGIIRKWVAFENSATPYPSDIEYDSRIVKSYIEEALVSRKDLETGRINAWTKFFEQAVIGIVVIFGVIIIAKQFFGFDIIATIFPPAPTKEPTQIENVATTAKAMSTYIQWKTGINL